MEHFMSKMVSTALVLLGLCGEGEIGISNGNCEKDRGGYGASLVEEDERIDSELWSSGNQSSGQESEENGGRDGCGATFSYTDLLNHGGSPIHESNDLPIYALWRVDNKDNGFSTQPFRIKYARQDVPFFIMVAFHLPLKKDEGPSSAAVIMKFKLLFAEIWENGVSLTATEDVVAGESVLRSYQTGKFISDSVDDQTEQVIKNMGEILKTGGADYSSVVKTTIM